VVHVITPLAGDGEAMQQNILRYRNCLGRHNIVHSGVGGVKIEYLFSL
jgi:hypothetical protein